MSEAENKTIGKRFNEDVWGTRDETALEELFAPDFVDHGALPGQHPTARATSRPSPRSAAPSPT
jgi:hypothetical protein